MKKIVEDEVVLETAATLFKKIDDRTQECKQEFVEKFAEDYEMDALQALKLAVALGVLISPQYRQNVEELVSQKDWEAFLAWEKAWEHQQRPVIGSVNSILARQQFLAECRSALHMVPDAVMETGVLQWLERQWMKAYTQGKADCMPAMHYLYGHIEGDDEAETEFFKQYAGVMD